MGFDDFSNAMGNLIRKPMHFPAMKYTTGWESHGKKSPIVWEKYECQLPRFTPYDGFCTYEKYMGKPMHFSYDEVYHRMEI